MIYLATPYNHEDMQIKEARYNIALDITQFFMKAYHTVFSPIVHCHHMHKLYEMPGDYPFWQAHDEEYIKASEEIWFAMMPGYSKSVGMRGEFELAKELNLRRRMVLTTPKRNWGQGSYIISDIQTGNFLRDPE